MRLRNVKGSRETIAAHDKVIEIGNKEYPNPTKRIDTNETYKYFDL